MLLPPTSLPSSWSVLHWRGEGNCPPITGACPLGGSLFPVKLSLLCYSPWQTWPPRHPWVFNHGNSTWGDCQALFRCFLPALLLLWSTLGPPQGSLRLFLFSQESLSCATCGQCLKSIFSSLLLLLFKAGGWFWSLLVHPKQKCLSWILGCFHSCVFSTDASSSPGSVWKHLFSLLCSCCSHVSHLVFFSPLFSSSLAFLSLFSAFAPGGWSSADLTIYEIRPELSSQDGLTPLAVCWLWPSCCPHCLPVSVVAQSSTAAASPADMRSSSLPFSLPSYLSAIICVVIYSSIIYSSIYHLSSIY